MGILDDSDSESDDASTCSEDSEEKRPKTKTAKARGAETIQNRNISVRAGSVDERLDAIRQLKMEMGIEQDPEYAEKERKKEERRKKEEEEQKRLEELSPEERIKAQQSSVGDMMGLIRQKCELSKRNLMAQAEEEDKKTEKTEVSKENGELSPEERIKAQQSSIGDMMGLIRQKRELSKRNLMAQAQGEDKKTEKTEVSKENDEMEQFRRLKLKKANSKKKLMEKKSKERPGSSKKIAAT